MFRIWATADQSLWQISNTLRALNVSHTIESSERAGKLRTVALGHKQPRQVHLTTRPVFVTGAINFISMPFALLADSNYPQMPSGDLKPVLMHCLMNAVRIEPEIKNMKAADYVMALARPSILNKIQTEVYRIQPYDLRKQVQSLIIKFFNGVISLRTMNQFLDRSIKTERLKPLINEGVPLRDAVLMMKHRTAEDIAAETGVQAFDLNYLTKSLK